MELMKTLKEQHLELQNAISKISEIEILTTEDNHDFRIKFLLLLNKHIETESEIIQKLQLEDLRKHLAHHHYLVGLLARENCNLIKVINEFHFHHQKYDSKIPKLYQNSVKSQESSLQ